MKSFLAFVLVCFLIIPSFASATTTFYWLNGGISLIDVFVNSNTPSGYIKIFQRTNYDKQFNTLQNCESVKQQIESQPYVEVTSINGNIIDMSKVNNANFYFVSTLRCTQITN